MIDLIEPILLAEVRGERDRVARSGVRPGQRPAADARVERQSRAGPWSRRRPSPSCRAAGASTGSGSAWSPFVQPRKMSLAACIIRWPWTTRSPGLRVAALRQMVLQHRRGRLLDLQEQRVLLIATLEQDDERSCARRSRRPRPCGPCRRLRSARAAGADHPAASRGRRGTARGWRARAPRPRDRCVGAEVTQRDDDRRLADDPVPAVDLLGQLRQRLQAVAAVRLPGGLLGLPSRPPCPRLAARPSARRPRA